MLQKENKLKTKEEILKPHQKNNDYDKKSHLYAYALVRKDLKMPSGKLSAQAGHAYTDTLKKSLEEDPERFHKYFDPDLGGSKVTLSVKNENQLINTYNKIRETGVPCSIVVDKNHVLPPYFDGNPIITALGIGPCTKDEVCSILKKFNCL